MLKKIHILLYFQISLQSCLGMFHQYDLWWTLKVYTSLWSHYGTMVLTLLRVLAIWVSPLIFNCSAICAVLVLAFTSWGLLTPNNVAKFQNWYIATLHCCLVSWVTAYGIIHGVLLLGCFLGHACHLLGCLHIFCHWQSEIFCVKICYCFLYNFCDITSAIPIIISVNIIVVSTITQEKNPFWFWSW